MSCFGGLLNEYKYLSIDRFDGVNLLSSAYFLSHCHTDHMVGLDSDGFKNRTSARKSIFLYCSEVTSVLLLADNRYSRVAEGVCALPVNDPKVIEIETDDGKAYLVTVTLLPAAHCPGSVMFFFEGDEGNVLYTGDFRFPKGSAKRMRNLHSIGGGKKNIKSMYVDTTFCIPNAVYIPSREDCLKCLKKIVGDWLREDNSHAIRLNVSAKYGYEYLFHALHEEFNTLIYCRRKHMYRCLPETHKILTDDPNNSKIFACFKKERVDKPQFWNTKEGEEKVPEHKKMLSITLSTMYFTYAALPHEVYQKLGKNIYRFCFSFHSSHSEVCDFVKYLQPENVYANVRPRDGMTLEQVEEKLAKECGLRTPVKNEVKFKPFGKPRDVVSCKQRSASNEEEVHSIKRALSLSSSDDEDSRELFQKLLNKSRRRCNELSDNTERTSSTENCENDRSTEPITDDDFNICSSPGSKEPMQNEIDALHVKIALNNGLPP